MIDAELHRFCEDDNAFFFKVSDYTDAVVGDLGFFKVRMAPTIIALVEMYSHEFENAIADVRFQGTLAGFYSTSQKKLYMYEGVKYHFQRPYINGNRPEFPFGFEPVPTQDMGQRLCNALTEHFLPRMKPLDVDVTDEDIIYSFDIDPKDREKIEKIFKRKATGFHIEDIRRIEYRKKVIFQV